MNPGWYPDPFARGWLRWWDGNTWTNHQTPAGAAPAAPVGSAHAPTNYGVAPVSPAQDIERENAWARYGRIAFLATGVLTSLSLLVVAPWAGHILRQDVDDCRASFDANRTCSTFGNHGSLVLDLVSLPVLVPQLVMMTWLFQVASVAARLGLPAHRQPGWAYALLVPVINFWFPYQVARDCFPPGHRGQSTVGWWWGFTLANTFTSIPVLILAAVSGVAASLLLAVPLAVLPIVSAVLGYRLVGQIRSVHLDLLSRYGG